LNYLARQAAEVMQKPTAPHSIAWFDRQLAHARACIALADKIHTPEELAAARAALAIAPDAPQQTLFNAKPNVGVATGGQPEPDGLAFALSQESRRVYANH
jgi:hypothetical protein